MVGQIAEELRGLEREARTDRRDDGIPEFREQLGGSADVASLAFTGRDAAEGKSFETWVRKYREKKAAGEKNIRLEPEKLE